MSGNVTFEAERLAYYNEYGRAMAAWTELEEVVGVLCSIFYPEGMPRNMLGMGLTGIQGFHSKLQFVNRSVTRGIAGAGKVTNERWEDLVFQLDELSAKRNSLA